MSNNKLILIILILFVFLKFCNNKENFDQNLVKNCKCQDNWSYWAPYTHEGEKIYLNGKEEIEFNGCDSRIIQADDINGEKKWCYTVGPCPNNNDPLSFTYQPFNSEVRSVDKDFERNNGEMQHTSWRYCNEKIFEDEKYIKDIIDNKFANLSKIVSKSECRGREKGTCLNNFNTCVPKCINNSSNRNKLLNELNQLMTCKGKMNDFVKKIDQANNGILLNGEINEDLEKEGFNLLNDNCGIELSIEIGKIYNDNKNIDINNKNKTQIKDILLQNRSKAMKHIHNFFSDKTREISSKYTIDFNNDECKNSKAILISETDDNNCCKKEQNCNEFLENELNGNSVDKINIKCLRNSIDDYKSLNTCSK